MKRINWNSWPHVYRSILHLFFPEICRLCKTITQPNLYLCSNCDLKLNRIDSSSCQICSKPFASDTIISHACADCLKNPPAFDWHRCAVLYQDPVRKWVSNFKFKNRLDYLPLFQNLMRSLAPIDLSEFIFIPVPLSKKRIRYRGYNQSWLLARALAKQNRTPSLKTGLFKVRDTASQLGLSRKERLLNLKGAFVAEPKLVSGKKVILVDDIFTTGATLHACAKALKKAGAVEVGAMTIAYNEKKSK